jgi:hypothetical protein
LPEGFFIDAHQEPPANQTLCSVLGAVADVGTLDPCTWSIAAAWNPMSEPGPEAAVADGATRTPAASVAVAAVATSTAYRGRFVVLKVIPDSFVCAEASARLKEDKQGTLTIRSPVT